MSLFGALGSIGGAALGSVIPGVGTALGASIGGGLGSALGGGGSSGGGGGGGGANQGALQMLAAQMAAANNPLTAAYQGLSIMQGAQGALMGLEANTKASTQLGIFKEALQRAQKEAQLQASGAGYSTGKGIDALANLAQGRLTAELLAPQFLQQAGSASLAGQNALANELGKTNIGVRAFQEKTLGDIAKNQSDTLNQVFATRAANQGRLALGAQAAESAMQLDRVRTLGDLARTREATKGQLALKKFGANQALAGARMFA